MNIIKAGKRPQWCQFRSGAWSRSDPGMNQDGRGDHAEAVMNPSLGTSWMKTFASRGISVSRPPPSLCLHTRCI